MQSVTMATLTHSDAATRTRLLNRLGMFHPNQMDSSCRNPSTLPHKKEKTGSVLGRASITPKQEQLKVDIDSSRLPPPSQKIKFNPSVSCVTIPNRYQYSDRIKRCLWSDQFELKQNAKRNIMEFEYEDFDWRKAVMDDEMYIDSINGEMVHPCHFSDAGASDFAFSDNDGFMPLKRNDTFVMKEMSRQPHQAC